MLNRPHVSGRRFDQWQLQVVVLIRQLSIRRKKLNWKFFVIYSSNLSGVQAGQCQRWNLPCVGHLPLAGKHPLRSQQHQPLHLPAHCGVFLSAVGESGRYGTENPVKQLHWNKTPQIMISHMVLSNSDWDLLVCFSPGGTLLTVKGFGFSPNTTVTLGSVECTLVYTSDTELRCRTPVVSVQTPVIPLQSLTTDLVPQG